MPGGSGAASKLDEVGAVHAVGRVPAVQSVTCTGAIGVPSWRR